MAILEDLPGIEATVRIDGEDLAEYDDDEEYQPQGDDVPQHRRAEVASSYIESETGAEFTINVSVGEPYKMLCPSLGFHVLVDGVRTKHCLLRNLDYSPHLGFEKEFRGPTIRDLVRKTKRTQNFTFANLETTTEDSKLADLAEDTKRVKGIGEIVIKVFRKGEAVKEFYGASSGSMRDGGMAEVHEKALKGEAKSHSVSFGRDVTRKIHRSWYWSANYLDGKNFPIAIFRFKYRSEEALKQLLILERTSEPDLGSPAPELSSLNPEQRREVKRYIDRLQSGSDVKVKHERDEDEEAVARPSKRARNSGKNIVVDLTNDSDDD